MLRAIILPLVSQNASDDTSKMGRSGTEAFNSFDNCWCAFQPRVPGDPSGQCRPGTAHSSVSPHPKKDACQLSLSAVGFY